MKKVILFFIASSMPTKEELAAAAKLGTQRFRNVKHIHPDECPETCDAVAGLVPENYSHLPRADVATEETPAETVTGDGAGEPLPPVSNGEQPTVPVDERAAQDASAKNATVKQLKEALVQLNIPFPASASKADLLQLFLSRP